MTVVSDNSDFSKSILCYNIRSLRCHHDQLTLDSSVLKPAIIALTETWLTQNDPNNIYAIEDYDELLTENRKSQRGGGVAIYVRSNFFRNYRVIQCKYLDECLTIETTESNGSRWVISVIYRAPNAQLQKFFDGLDEHLDYLKTKLPKAKIILCGDLNIDFLNVDNDNTRKLNNLLISYGLRNNVKEPTRVTPTTRSGLDYIISENFLRVRMIEETCSDHFAVTAEVFCDTFEPNVKSEFRYRNWEKLNTYDIKLRALFLLLQKIEDIDPTYSLDQKLKKFCDGIFSVLDKFCPIQSQTKYNSYRCAWDNKKIRKAMQEKNIARKRMLKSNTAKDKKTFRSCRNKLVALIRRSKKDYFSNKLGPKPSPKKFFVETSVEAQNQKQFCCRFKPDEPAFHHYR